MPSLSHHPAQPLQRLLAQIDELIEAMDDRAYTRSRSTASIGEHLRHSLDHVQCFANALADGDINYDRRQRGTLIETDRGETQRLLTRLQQQLQTMIPAHVDQPVRIEVMTQGNGDSLNVNSTLGRELAFVLSHTLHHNAIIRTLIDASEMILPDDFGYVPSTIAHRKAAGLCVPSQ